MTRDFDSGTRVTLLGRLQCNPTDADAWREFVDHYGRKVYAWCRRWDLQEADAHDVTQDVLLRLAGKMRDFRYDPTRSFRAWLKTLAQHAWSDFVAARRRSVPVSTDSGVAEQIQSVEAREDLARQLEAEFDLELFEEAKRRVRLRVEPHTWDAFCLTAVDGLSGAEAAARLGMKVATVFVARSKVQKMLQEEVQKLEGEESAATGAPSGD
jgi:RNA polymerase sigma-70 factor (ECF subfamily)